MKKQTVLAACALLALLTTSPLAAQTLSGCSKTELQDPPRSVYRCAGGITLDAEAVTALGIVERQADDRPIDVEVSKDGLYIEVTPGSGPFQIQTPHAIAAVRGTVYVVDVTDTMTAVFVREGEVSVSRTDGSDPVLLTPGLGVEVEPGTPLETRRWPAARVDALLSRFGR